MLNPSIANGFKDDPTIRKCVAIAKALHYDRLEVVNLFAYRATDPADLLRLEDKDDPYGIRSQNVIETAAIEAGIIICAWGAHGTFLGHNETVLGWLGEDKLHTLGFTKNGQPGHPLFIPATTTPQIWKP